MVIRKAKPDDLPAVLKIYQHARQFMAAKGNPTQWGDSYPPAELISQDIGTGGLYVCEANGEVHGVFFFEIGSDPSYAHIEDGAWLSDTPYGVIHRVASNGQIKGLLTQAVRYCSDIIPHLRIDTHQNNLIMQHLILKNGFTKCGTVFMEDGSSRIAFEKIKS